MFKENVRRRITWSATALMVFTVVFLSVETFAQEKAVNWSTPATLDGKLNDNEWLPINGGVPGGYDNVYFIYDSVPPDGAGKLTPEIIALLKKELGEFEITI